MEELTSEVAFTDESLQVEKEEVKAFVAQEYLDKVFKLHQNDFVWGKGYDYFKRKARLRLNPRMKSDLFTVISGGEGTGKTHLAIDIGLDFFVKEKIIQPFFIKSNVQTNPTPLKVVKKIKELPHYSAIAIDELDKILNKKDFGSAGVKYLEKVFKMSRKEHKFIIGCLPNFWTLDKEIRNNRIPFRMYAMFWEKIGQMDRGIGVVHESNLFDDDYDPWFKEEIQEITKDIRQTIARNKSNPTAEMLLNAMKDYPTFRGRIYWNPLPKEFEKDYLELLEEDNPIEDIISEMEAKEKNARRDTVLLNKMGLLLNYINGFMKVDPSIISEVTNMDQKTTVRLINRGKALEKKKILQAATKEKTPEELLNSQIEDNKETLPDAWDLKKRVRKAKQVEIEV